MIMAKIDLEYVQAFEDRHGTMRYYFRRKGYKRITLPGPPGSTKFAAAYEAARQAMKPAATSVVEGPRSMGAAIAEYYLSLPFKSKTLSTQKGYRDVLEKFRGEYGRDLVVNFKPVHLEAIFHGMADTPAQASNLRKRLKAVLAIAKRLGWIAENPIERTDKIEYRPKGFTPWSEDDIAAYRTRWAPGTRERLALELLLNTGVRRSDVVALGRQHVSGGHVSIVQTKTAARLKIPVHADLARELALWPIGTTFLLTQYGLPFSRVGFSQWFVERAQDAGLTGRTPHGLRKAAGRRLAEAGCSDKQIAAVLGHTSPSTAAVYTRDADQAKLADDAMQKLAEAGS
jgi:integrase